jgi:preprotein translocase subunit SecA
MIASIKKRIPLKEARELKSYYKIVEQINIKEKQYENFTDEQLKEKTTEFKQQLEGKTVHDIVADAFAVVREASKRILGLRHYDVQLLGGLVLIKGNVAEMVTGEGKTLVASLASYLIALEGKGVHVITSNDYLASRDKELIGQIHEFLGLTVGLNIAGMSGADKQEAYACDITYGVGTEFGFDYLRDNTVPDINNKVQRPYHYAIVDEIDSILIDEAKTPLIIAGKDKPSDRMYSVCARATKSMEPDDDYTYDVELKTVNFTEKGINKCEKMFGIGNMFDLEHSALFHALLQSLRARVLFERDVDYIVEEGEVKLVDMSTGRVMEGRSLSDGLHQAIESKEGLVNTEENKTHASITIQNYYRMYPKLSGMTGTAKTEEKEMQTIYGMDVIDIPTNKAKQRIDMPDLVYITSEQKYTALVEEVKTRHMQGQPILIGTTSILQSETVSEYLEKENLPHQLLNAKSVEQEAQFIAMAGQKGQITIATNMAGRGTDIMLGEETTKLGGLHVIGTERNDSGRIDDQLKGRSGRQGDPGSSQFIISLEDYLFVRYATDELERIKPKLKHDKKGLITTQAVHKFVDTAQKISEGVHYSFRDFNLKLENVLNSQRDVVYQLRDKLLSEENLLAFITKQTASLPEELAASYCDPEIAHDDRDVQGLDDKLNNILLPDISLTRGNLEETEDVLELIQSLFKEHQEQIQLLEDREDIQESARRQCLYVIDTLWKKHLDTMNQLREGIGIRQYQQEDPIVLFEKEGYNIFREFYREMEYEFASRITFMIKHLLHSEEESI